MSNTRILFVHGTGVRQESHDKTLASIRKHLVPHGFEVVGCPWGAKYGVRKDLLQVMLPPNSTRALEGQSEGLSDLWSMLLEDPFFELRIAEVALRNPEPPASDLKNQTAYTLGNIGQRSVGQNLNTAMQSLQGQLGIENTIIQAYKLDPSLWASAARRAREEPVVQEVLKLVTPQDASAVAHMVARCMLACYLQSLPSETRSDCPLCVPESAKQATEDLALVLLPAASRGMREWLQKKALELATQLMRSKRKQLMDFSTLFIGDVFTNIHHKQSIREMIHDAIEESPENLVIIAHSLGAMIVFDLCLEKQYPHLKLLVTVGAQVPYFYAMEALDHLRPDYDKGAPPGSAQPPASFVQWLNVYNPNDFLSFPATGVFKWPGILEDQVCDRQVPFPMSHGDYFENPTFYDLVLQALKNQATP